MNKNVKVLFKILFYAFAVIAGAYVGLGLCLIGGILGIVKFIENIIATGDVAYGQLAWSILRIMLSTVAGWTTIYVLSLVGILFFPSNEKVKILRKR